MKYAYGNGIILDGTLNMEPKKDMIVLIEHEKIVDIVDKGTDISGYEFVDLKGKYLMPGLINLHVHLPGSGKPLKEGQDNGERIKKLAKNPIVLIAIKKICEKYAKMELMSGVTTIRTVGGAKDYDTKIRDKIASGRIIGPRILASNYAISVPDGHMAGSLAYVANSPKEARAYVKKIANDRPDLIKLMITGGVLDAKAKGEPGVLKMPPAYVKAACEEAHRLGLQVAAHVESPEGVRVALENGVDTIEHGAKPDETILKLFQERHACQVATLSPALPYALFDRSISHASKLEQYNGNIVFEGIIECAKACLKNNIPVGLGTDTGCPYVTHYDMWRELVYYHKFCHVSNAFALHTATLINAQIAGIAAITGSIEIGKCADLIVTAENPLEDLKALRTIDMVVAGGRIIDHPRIKKVPEIERELDKFL
ncbi:MAG: amidohydrolase family protein [Erysipelotrichaceae bacterium]|nr:amidohydrolase family protein [Erysipelotrichaceae bacterium]